MKPRFSESKVYSNPAKNEDCKRLTLLSYPKTGKVNAMKV